jgi:hypothetical protein
LLQCAYEQCTCHVAQGSLPAALTSFRTGAITLLTDSVSTVLGASIFAQATVHAILTPRNTQTGVLKTDTTETSRAFFVAPTAIEAQATHTARAVCLCACAVLTVAAHVLTEIPVEAIDTSFFDFYIWIGGRNAFPRVLITHRAAVGGTQKLAFNPIMAVLARL